MDKNGADMKKKYKATVALGISVLGAIGTSGVASSGFLGGMIHNGFLAATIGGMADWFAVTALFRKPLGISYKTEILIKNRQRIMQALIDFVADDLLSTDNIMRFAGKQDMSKLVSAYIESKGTEVLAQELAMTLRETLVLADDTLASELAPSVGNAIREKLPAACSRGILEGLATREQAEIITGLLISLGQQLLAEEDLRPLIRDTMGTILRRYEGNGMGRGFIMGLIGLNEEKLTDILLEKAKAYLSSLENRYFDETPVVDYGQEDQEGHKVLAPIDTFAENSARIQLEEKVLELLQQLRDNQELEDALTGKLQGLLGDENVENMLRKALEQVRTAESLRQNIKTWLAEFLREYTVNRELQLQADKWLKTRLAGMLENNHQVIVSMIEERLNELSDEKLVEFAEEKVADDLQMIRINGSVVGSIAGMLIYTITFLAGQVFKP